jgi:glycerate kinase
MKVVAAPDKFRGSLTALQACRALARGIRSADPTAEVDEVPMADGGEGTVDALVAATGGSLRHANVTGPLGESVRAVFGILGDGQTAALEMAAASGAALVPRGRRDPSRTTTRGSGELLLAAAATGVRRIIIGIGGSATNDGGAGMAQALGFRLMDREGHELQPGGGALSRLDRIVPPEPSDRMLEGVEIAVACDVESPLCGPHGASAVFGPQKGADPAMVEELDRNLAHFAEVVRRDLGIEIAETPGSGAAGGLGGGLIAFAGGRLEPGVPLITRAVNLAARLEGADLCLTGEGSIDASSVYGKTAVGVARLAHQLGCPTIALAGVIGPGSEGVLEQGIDAIFSVCPGPLSLDDALSRAEELLERATAQVVRCFLAACRRSEERRGGAKR